MIITIFVFVWTTFTIKKDKKKNNNDGKVLEWKISTSSTNQASPPLKLYLRPLILDSNFPLLTVHVDKYAALFTFVY